MAITKQLKLRLMQRLSKTLFLVARENFEEALEEAEECAATIEEELTRANQNGATDKQSSGFHFGGGGCTRGTLKPQPQGA